MKRTLLVLFLILSFVGSSWGQSVVSVKKKEVLVMDAGYSEANQDDYYEISATNGINNGQSFVSGGGTLDSVKFYLRKHGTPPGTYMYANIFAHTGTFGTSSVSTGTALAVSDGVALSELTDSYDWVTFNFTGAARITLTQSTYYTVTLNYTSGDDSNEIYQGLDVSSPSHGGNSMYYASSTWTAYPDADVCFYVYVYRPQNSINVPLTVHASNGRYFDSGNGKALFLTGSHTWPVLRDDYTNQASPTLFEWDLFMANLVAWGHNYLRMWVWDLPKYDCAGGTNYRYVSPFPWNRPGPGTATDDLNKFDLTSFNDDYFTRLRTRVIDAKNKGIYVGIQLFDGYSLQFCRDEDTDGFPYTAANNINSVDDHGGLNSMTLTYSAVTNAQKAYIAKVVDTVWDLDNVLFDIVGEGGSGSTAWVAEMISYLNTYQAGKAKQHPVGFSYQFEEGLNATLFASDADYVSPGLTATVGDPDGYLTGPPIAAGSKVTILDTDHISNDSAVEYFWRAFTRGHSIIYMDEYGYDAGDPEYGTENDNRIGMGHIKRLAHRIGLASMAPSSTISSSGYALYNSGAEYLVYQAATGAFTVTMVAGSYAYQWINPATGAVTHSGNYDLTDGANNFNTSTPGYYPTVLYLKLN